MTQTSNRIAATLAAALALGAFDTAAASPQSAQAPQAGNVLQAQLKLDLQAEADIQTIANQIAAALAEQGYRVVEAKKTWLGRLKVVAENAEARREVVVSSTTGAIMRDSIVEVFAQGKAEAGAEGRPAATGTARDHAEARSEDGRSGGAVSGVLGAVTGKRESAKSEDDDRSGRSNGGASVRGSASASGSLGLGL